MPREENRFKETFSILLLWCDRMFGKDGMRERSRRSIRYKIEDEV